MLVSKSQFNVLIDIFSVAFKSHLKEVSDCIRFIYTILDQESRVYFMIAREKSMTFHSTGI